MNACGKSDACIVPKKLPNKDRANLPAEAVEERRTIKGNVVQPAMPRTQSRKSVSSGLQRVRTVARKDKDARFTSLLHHVTITQLKERLKDLPAGLEHASSRKHRIIDNRLDDDAFSIIKNMDPCAFFNFIFFFLSGAGIRICPLTVDFTTAIGTPHVLLISVLCHTWTRQCQPMTSKRIRNRNPSRTLDKSCSVWGESEFQPFWIYALASLRPADKFAPTHINAKK